ncbi:MAG: guanylate kinase [Saprospiraceae bacterium]|nr:guanylate kinase [Saprospiraceae bacterium]
MGNQNKTIVFTAPSGAGKTTIVKHLLAKFPDKLAFSISATTRQKRDIETDGKDYYFISAQEFRKKIIVGDFIEWEEVYDDQYYGTLKSEIERIWEQGKIVVFDVDVKGATSIKKYFKENCMAVFVSPPSIEILIDRLKNRGTETPQSLKKRIARVRTEMKYKYKFDEIIVNDELQLAFSDAEKLIDDFAGITKNP